MKIIFVRLIQLGTYFDSFELLNALLIADN